MSDPIWDAPLSAEEFARREAEMRARLRSESAEEREAAMGLIRWFRRRYPTPLLRIQYIRAQTKSTLRVQAYVARQRAEGE